MRNLRLNHKKVPALTVDSEAFVIMWNLIDLIFIKTFDEVNVHKIIICGKLIY